MLVHAQDTDAVQTGRVIDQDTSTFGQDRVVGGVPRHAEPFGDARHGQVLGHDADKAPPQPRTEIFARGAAAAVVSWRHTCEHSMLR